MNLYIEITDGVTKNHPALEENLIQAFGLIPENWEPFVRAERPVLEAYEILRSEEPIYEKIDGTWKDVWSVREMTEEEKIVKQNEVKDYWSINGYASWIFNEDTCSFNAPVSYPDDGERYYWDEETTSWEKL
tara:strand:+ start:1037 stop:1432 length:396 start_codon:yes stop_codon:yes gene_type:complete